MDEPLTGWMPFEEWRNRVPVADAAGTGDIQAKPAIYAGAWFRSTLEADWACTLDHCEIRWEYEPEMVTLPSGKHYVPDFRLPSLNTWIEVKGPHLARIGKAAEFARQQMSAGTIVITGFTPARHTLTPFKWERYLQWDDPAGYDARLARCQDCDAWQWLRPRLSASCRVCGARYRGLLATSGEMPFSTAPPESILGKLKRMESA